MQKQACILDGESSLLGELFQEFYLLGRKAACSPVVDLNCSQYGTPRGDISFFLTENEPPCTMFSRCFEDGCAQHRTRTTGLTSIIETRKIHLGKHAGGGNNE